MSKGKDAQPAKGKDAPPKRLGRGLSALFGEAASPPPQAAPASEGAPAMAPTQRASARK